MAKGFKAHAQTGCNLVKALAACGDTARDRMLSGAGIGAVGGTLVGGATTLHPHFPVGP